MTCREALALAERMFAADTILGMTEVSTVSERQAFRKHVKGCPECLSWAKKHIEESAKVMPPGEFMEAATASLLMRQADRLKSLQDPECPR